MDLQDIVYSVVVFLLIAGWTYLLYFVGKELKPVAHKIFDNWWLPDEDKVPIKYTPGQDEKLELVIESTPKIVVIVDMALGAVFWLGIGLTVSVLLYVVIQIWDLVSISGTETPFMSWGYFQAMLIPLLLSTAGIPFTYFLSTWKIKYYRLVIFTKTAFFVHVRPYWWSIIPLYKGIEWTITDGPTVLLEEARIESSLKKLAQHTGVPIGWIERIIASYMANSIGAGSIIFYSRVFQAADLFKNVANAFNYRKIVKKIAEAASLIILGLKKTQGTIADIKLKGGPRVGQEIQEALDKYVEAFRAESSALGGTHAEIDGEYNLLTVPDPKIWNPKTGDLFTVVAEEEVEGVVRDMSVFQQTES